MGFCDDKEIPCHLNRYEQLKKVMYRVISLNNTPRLERTQNYVNACQQIYTVVYAAGRRFVNVRKSSRLAEGNQRALSHPEMIYATLNLFFPNLLYLFPPSTSLSSAKKKKKKKKRRKKKVIKYGYIIQFSLIFFKSEKVR